MLSTKKDALALCVFPKSLLNDHGNSYASELHSLFVYFDPSAVFVFGTFFFWQKRRTGSSLVQSFPEDALLIDCAEEDDQYSPEDTAGRASQDKLGDRWHSYLFDVQPSVLRKTGAGQEIGIDQDPIGPPKTERNFEITMRWKQVQDELKNKHF